MQVLTSIPLKIGTALSIQFTFGSKVCYLTLSGRVVACRPLPSNKGYSIEIHFVGLQEDDRRILNSAIEDAISDPTIQERSFVTVTVTKDDLASEAQKLTSSFKKQERSADDQVLHVRPRGLTPDPEWVDYLKYEIEPLRSAVLECPLVRQAASGTLPLRQMQNWMIQLYPFIETFPKWLALSITKTEDPRSRSFLIENVRVEKKHAEQWLHMATGFGVPQKALQDIRPMASVEALTHWLWSINTQGTLAEGVSATSFAIEGVTHDIAVAVVKGFPKYEGQEGVKLDRKTYWWMEAHAKYDDLHPIYALEIIKQYTQNEIMVERVVQAAKRSLEYLQMAFDACYTYSPPTHYANCAEKLALGQPVSHKS